MFIRYFLRSDGNTKYCHLFSNSDARFNCPTSCSGDIQGLWFLSVKFKQCFKKRLKQPDFQPFKSLLKPATAYPIIYPGVKEAAQRMESFNMNHDVKFSDGFNLTVYLIVENLSRHMPRLIKLDAMWKTVLTILINLFLWTSLGWRPKTIWRHTVAIWSKCT